MLTCYDYSTLVNKEVGAKYLVGRLHWEYNACHEDIQVTMEDMIQHAAAVSRGLKNSFISQICHSNLSHTVYESGGLRQTFARMLTHN